MKNLKLYSLVSLKSPFRFDHESLLLSAFDVENNRLFFASSANNIYALHLPSSEDEKGMNTARVSSDVQELSLDSGDCIAAMEYVMEKEALLVGTTNGCIILHNVDSGVTEVVGNVDGGVRAIACSPDGALVAVMAGFGQILVLTVDWDVLHETAPEPQVSRDACEGDLHGSSASRLQSPISWRGDGKYFATLVRDYDTSLQKLKIWERESGTWLAMSESKAFMGVSLDWMPSGAKVATAYDRSSEKKCPLIVFFEKNGLERSSFTADEQVDTKVKALKWNCNSDLLAASVACDGYDAIKIWYFSNNHWYLKREIRYESRDEVKFVWDPKKPFHLICWTSSGTITTYRFLWITAVTESSIAFVIDNSKVLVSPLALSLMPPPMYLFCMKFKAALQEVAFLSVDAKSHLAAYLSDGSLCVVEFPNTDIWEQLEGKEFVVESSSICDASIGKLINLAWLDPQRLICISESTRGYLLHEIEMACSGDCVTDAVNSSGWHAEAIRCLPLERSVLAVAPNPTKRHSAFIQMEGGSIMEYTSNAASLKAPLDSSLHEADLDMRLTSPCPLMKSVLVCDNAMRKPLIFGLDNNARLHAGRRLLCDGCSSFTFYSSSSWTSEQVATHLLVTKDDSLFVIDIGDILRNPEMKIGSQDNSLLNRGEGNRNSMVVWERGARLVGALHGDEAAIILQAVRGNLECIYPRKLVLVSIFKALAEARYKDAILMVRRHRIDFNVVVDYFGWQAFLKLASAFVSQVCDLSHITEFVSSIKNENVLDTLYKGFVTLPKHNDAPGGHGKRSMDLGMNCKVSLVLLAIRNALVDQVQESPARELCILTTLARSDPPAIEEALKRIKTTREAELSYVNPSKGKSFSSAEESLKHLLWLTDSKAVYEAALGLYDLNLAAIVALNSQKDPKEFLPFLRELEQMPPVIMRYTIDLKLHRYESALRQIVSAGDDHHDDCMNLLKSNPELFPLGLRLLLADDSKRSQVQEAWGDFLFDDKCFHDAATAYLCCSSFQKALKSYRAGGDWKGVLTVAGILRIGKDEVLRLANELCDEFQALGKPSEAAKVALDYCGDVARGVGLLVIAREWEEALRLGFMHEREDLVSDVKEAALECAAASVSEYREATDKVKKYSARYLAVRQRRLVLASKVRPDDHLPSDAESDCISEAGSGFSDMSAYTTTRSSLRYSTPSVNSSAATSSKARETRRQQRSKGGKIRAGSPGEEAALVEHLKGLSLADGPRRELGSLLSALVMLGKEETARQLQGVVDTFVLSQEAAVKLAEDTMVDDSIDETTQTLEYYLKQVRPLSPESSSRSWRSEVLLPAVI